MPDHSARMQTCLKNVAKILRRLYASYVYVIREFFAWILNSANGSIPGILGKKETRVVEIYSLKVNHGVLATSYNCGTVSMFRMVCMPCP
jgi:hypothetical protein